VHAVALILVIAFLWLGWWQLGRAEQGNALSFGYACEWPAFAAFVVFVWVRELRLALRDQPGTGAVAGGIEPAPAASPNGATSPDPGTSPNGATSPESGTSPNRATPAGPASPLMPGGVAAAVARRASQRRIDRAGPGHDDSNDAPLAAYNRYLAWLNANPQASRSDYPG
jgi:hypothetical protein